jgi:hypothetical protein
MSNEAQLRMAEFELWLIVKELGVATAVAAPPVTNFEAPVVPQAPGVHGTGNGGAA